MRPNHLKSTPSQSIIIGAHVMNFGTLNPRFEKGQNDLNIPTLNCNYPICQNEKKDAVFMSKSRQ